MRLEISKDLELLPVPDRTSEAVGDLVDRYARNRDQYRSSAYNEARVRQEFINPFFAALGWDMENQRGYSEAYKEVIHEDTVRVGGVAKAPDYCFRYGGQRKFYVEAKAPAVNLKTDTSPAYQLRRYGWSAKLPLSVLTDFEEFAIYDCRLKPADKDPSALARVGYLTCDQYLENLQVLYSIFAYEAIPRGFFDRYAEGGKGKRGTSTVDAEFLKEIERWRDELARAIARRNTVSVHQLNYAVQTIIDRILFLRIAEDRGVERDGQLQEIAARPHLYTDLCKAFADADEKYNSGLFDFSAKGDQCTPGLDVDSRVLKDIIASLYYPRSPYEFSVIGADILGAVYEQFLGKVIRLTPAGLAKVEEKPEVKKAGGVYYTPRYIVDYIVEHTVGETVREAGTPQNVARLRVLDPACGSGSFLLGAYDWLLKWHLQHYVDHDPNKQLKARRPVLVLDSKGEWRLSTAERKRILLDNLYGVDIDPQAVEVTKLNLLLKCLEGETEQTLQTQQQMFHERVLPNIDGNIKCGNSLIGPDYYTGRMDYDKEERRRVNAFDWHREFPEIMKAGGFDCVIGNPPYLGGREWTGKQAEYYDYCMRSFETLEYQFDLFAAFIEKSMSIAKADGYVSMITPNVWLNNLSNLKLRAFLLEQSTVVSIADYTRVQVFAKATVLPIVWVLARSVPGPDSAASVLVADHQGYPAPSHRIAQRAWCDDPDKIININLRTEEIAVRDKVQGNGRPLDTWADVKFGIKLYETGKGDPPQTPDHATNHQYEATFQKDDTYRPYLEGKDINRYSNGYADRWLKYGRCLAAPRDPGLFEGERLLVRRITGERLLATYVDLPYVTSQLLQVVKPKSSRPTAKYVLGVLSSRLMAWHFKAKYNRQDKTFPEIRIYELAALPIRPIDFANPSDVAKHDQMVSLVQTMLDLNERLPLARTPRDRDLLQRQIEDTDAAIDRLVYELYELTDEEIAIVKGDGQ